MKKCVSIILAVVMIISLFSIVPVSAAETGTTDAPSYAVGDTVIYTYKLTTAEKVEAVEAVVSYDPAVFELQTTTAEELFPVLTDVELAADTAGEFSFNALDVNGFDFTAGATLVTAEFLVVGEGDGNVETTISNMCEYTGTLDIVYYVQDGTVVKDFEAEATFEIIPVATEPPTEEETEDPNAVGGNVTDIKVEDVVGPLGVDTYRYYFVMPEFWENSYSTDAGIYWWEGTAACATWPGYAATKSDIPGVYYADVPTDVTTIIWTNRLNGGTDETADVYTLATQSFDIGSEYYDPGESDFHPDGTAGFDGMIYIIDPTNTDFNVLNGKMTYGGEWFYFDPATGEATLPESDLNPNGVSINVKDQRTWTWSEAEDPTEPEPTEPEPTEPEPTEPEPTEPEPTEPEPTEPEPTEPEPTEKPTQAPTNDPNQIPPVGTTVTYTFYLQADSIIKLFQGAVYYDSSVFKLVSTKNSAMVPVISKVGSYVVNKMDGEIQINGTHVAKGYNFTTEGIFFTADFEVISTEGEGYIFTDLEFLVGMNDEPYIYEYVVGDDFSAKEEVTYDNGTYIPPTPTQAETQEPTQEPTPAETEPPTEVETEDPNAQGGNVTNIKVEDVVGPLGVETYRYYFVMPEFWENSYSKTAGIYWWEGTAACATWPGYAATPSNIPNVYYADVPTDVTTIIWTNRLNGGTDETADVYTLAVQSFDIGSEYYDPGESDFHPDGTPGFDGMIYVIDPTNTDFNVLNGKLTYGGEWFYFDEATGEATLPVSDKNPEGVSISVYDQRTWTWGASVDPTEKPTDAPAIPPVGTIITYTYDMTIPNVLENFSGQLFYDNTVYKLIEKDDIAEYVPVAAETGGYDVNVNTTDGWIRYVGSDVNDGYDFTNGGTLITAQFEVISTNGEGYLYNVVDNINCANGDRYIKDGVVIQEHDYTETIDGMPVVPPTQLETTPQPTTPQPTTPQPTTPSDKPAIGSIITYTYEMTIPNALENFSGQLFYDNTVYKLIEEDDLANYVPVAAETGGYDVNVNTADGWIRYVGSDVNDGYDFTNGGILITAKFEVIGDTDNGYLYNVVDNINCANGDRYIKDGVVIQEHDYTEKVEVDGKPVVIPTQPETTPQPTTPQPTKPQPTIPTPTQPVEPPTAAPGTQYPTYINDTGAAVPPVGTIVTYTYYLDADAILENFDGQLFYDPSVYRLVSTDQAAMLPVVSKVGGYTVNSNLTGSVDFNFTDATRGYPFKNEGVLFTAQFEVLKEEIGNMYLVIEDMTGAGDQKIVYGYVDVQDYSNRETLEWTTPETFSLVIDRLPDKTTYLVGESLDLTGIKVSLVSSKGTITDVTDSIYTKGFSSATTGSKTVSVCYDQYTTTFDVQVVERGIIGIRVEKAPTKTEYVQGQALDTTGLKVVAVYNDGTTEDITNDVAISGYNSQQLGNQNIKVSYKTFSTTFPVTVVSRAVVSIDIISEPYKTSYVEGQILDVTGLKVNAIYNDGTTEDVTSKVGVTGYNSKKVGTQTITVSYSNCTDTFAVYVSAKQIVKIKVLTPPDKTYYFSGQVLDVTGLTLLATYNNGTTEVVDSGYSVAGFNTATLGKQNVTVTYQNKSDAFQVTVRLLGDVDLDGKVTIKDVTLVQKERAQIVTLTDEQYAVYDTNWDGKYSIHDATRIQKYNAKMIPSLLDH